MYTNLNHIKDYKARMQLIWAKAMAAFHRQSEIRLAPTPGQQWWQEYCREQEATNA